MRPSRTRLLLLSALVGLVGAFVVIPWVIRQGHAELSLPVINDVFEGRTVHDVDFYLSAWWSVALPAVGGFASLALLLFFAGRRWGGLRAAVAYWTGRGATLSGGEFVSVALSLGLVGGLAQAAYLAIRHVVTRRPAAQFFWELMWMAPLASAVATLVLAAALGALARFGRMRVGVVSAAVVFVLPGAVGLLRADGIPLYGYAEFLIAFGVTAMIGRWVAAHPRAVAVGVRASPLFNGVLGLVLVAVAVLRWPSVSEARALRGLPAADGGPNVLLIILDTVRADHLGLYGYGRDTSPTLDAWALGGAVFERAYATSSWTLPTHASLFTGEYPYEARTGPYAPLGEGSPTLAEVLAGSGYATAGFVGNLGYTSPTSGLDRGFARYQAHRLTVGQALASAWLPKTLSVPLVRLIPGLSAEKIGAHVTNEFLAWLDEPRDRPFFAFLNYFDAHDSYNPPEPYRSRFGPGPLEPWPTFVERWFREGGGRPDPGPWIDRYDGGIAYVDHQLARVFQALEERGLTENTLIVVTSDHGEHWGEHGLILHRNSVYQAALHVPLLIAFPGMVEPGLRVDADVTLRDVPATILSWVETEGAEDFPGEPIRLSADSLDRGVTGSPRLGELRPTEESPYLRTLFENDLQYVWRDDGGEEAYWVGRDTVDVVNRSELAERLARLRAQLEGLGPIR